MSAAVVSGEEWLGGARHQRGARILCVTASRHRIRSSTAFTFTATSASLPRRGGEAQKSLRIPVIETHGKQFPKDKYKDSELTR
ncbi:hypothetical protein E2C01_009132 [Portunus trituberculatus]|uniref:Uncharacterized protein n=1 Tax=Portunus trituberculatus TaxID=210409 RepID=A0A5B7D4K9_PORTR|nr:hypothetical protein [Portunus trituberculatus]